MNTLRLSVSILSVFGIGGSVGPWFHESMGNSTFFGIEGDGIISLLVFAATLLVALISKNLRNPMKKARKVVVVVLALLVSAFGIYKYVDLLEAFNTTVMGVNFSYAFSFGYGLYVVIASGLLIVVTTFLLKDTKKTQMHD